MNRNQILMAIGGLLLVVAGVGLSRRHGYAEGRFSACKEFFARMNAVYGQEVYVCVKEGGDAFITSPLAPGRKFTLSGELVN